MNVVCAGRRTRTLFQKMIRVILIIAAVMFSSVLGYHFGQQETELRWTREREQLLAHQIETLHRKDKEIAQLEKREKTARSLENRLLKKLNGDSVDVVADNGQPRGLKDNPESFRYYIN